MHGAIQSLTLALVVFLLSAVRVHAQELRDALPISTWAFGASGEMSWSRDRWGDPHVDGGFDANVERRLLRVGKRDVLGVRVQLGRGAGDGYDGGFGYTRLLAGVIRHACLRQDECYGDEGYAFYFVGGGGAYLVTSSGAGPSALVDSASFPAKRRARPSVFAGFGSDRKLGTPRMTLRMEMRLYSIGTDLQAAASLGVQIHIR